MRDGSSDSWTEFTGSVGSAAKKNPQKNPKTGLVLLCVKLNKHGLLHENVAGKASFTSVL